MSTKGDRDAAIDALLRTSLRGGGPDAGPDCPSAALLAAFVEGSLSPSERECADAHLAACQRCQETLAALSEMPAPKLANPRPAWISARWLVPAAAVMSVLILYVALKPQGRVPASTPDALVQLQPKSDLRATTTVAGAESNAKREAQALPAPEKVPGTPAKLVAQSTTPSRVPAPSSASQPFRGANVMKPAPSVPAGVDALEVNRAAPAAAPQMAAAGNQPVSPPAAPQPMVGAAADKAAPLPTSRALASPTALAEPRERRVDAIAESVGVAVGGTSTAQSTPPIPYEDPGACPFEGCAYREWVANADVVTRKDPLAGSAAVYTVKKGERVAALTGIVRILKPGRVVFREPVDIAAFADGAWGRIHVDPADSLYLLTYHGEGNFKAWFRGKLYENVEGTTFYNAACEFDPSLCRGRIVEPTQWVWWVKVKSAAGQIGWTNQPDKFDGKDELSGKRD